VRVEEARHSGGAVAPGEGETVRVLDAVVRHLRVHHAGGERGRRFGRLGRTLGLLVRVLRLANLVRPRLSQFQINRHSREKKYLYFNVDGFVV
jgi:hypothetical protein